MVSVERGQQSVRWFVGRLDGQRQKMEKYCHDAYEENNLGVKKSIHFSVNSTLHKIRSVRLNLIARCLT